jgi:prepilin-type N-terminal cleavage/methylation domain-containing protein
MGKSHALKGFTLVEMSVVLVVIALITAMGLAAGLDSIESTRRVSTEKKLDVIEKALFTYREKYGRLPCPASSTLAATDANYGLAATNLGNCFGGTPSADTVSSVAGEPAVPQGAVPVRTLNLPDEFMFDGWKQKFRYDVTPEMTNYFAFVNSSPYDSCATTVVDHSGADMPIKVVYSLISYGSNGLGAYLKTGAQNGVAGASAAENTNIRATNSANSVRIKNGVSGTGNSYFDDIVRTKTRYQMMSDNERTMPVYRGPDMVFAYNTTTSSGGAPQIVFAKRICGRYEVFTPAAPLAAVAAIPQYAGFTPNNTNLFIYHTAICKLYRVSGTTIDAVTSGTPVPNCPAAATTAAIAKTSGHMAINSASSPYIHTYSMGGTGLTAVYTELAGGLSPVLASIPENITMSENGDYLTVSSTSAPYAKLYLKNGTTYEELTATSGGPGTPLVNAISPDGKYYVEAALNTSIDIYVWRNVSGTFTLLSGGGASYTFTGKTSVSKIQFSDSSDTLGVMLDTNDWGALYINPITDLVSVGEIISLSYAMQNFSITKDGKQFALATASTSDPYDVNIYGHTDYTYGGASVFPQSDDIKEGSASAYVRALAAAH